MSLKFENVMEPEKSEKSLSSVKRNRFRTDLGRTGRTVQIWMNWTCRIGCLVWLSVCFLDKHTALPLPASWAALPAPLPPLLDAPDTDVLGHQSHEHRLDLNGFNRLHLWVSGGGALISARPCLLSFVFTSSQWHVLNITFTCGSVFVYMLYWIQILTVTM